MDYWEKFNAISLLKKERFKSLLNMEDITDKNRPHVKGVCKEFEIKNVRDLYVQGDTLLLW